MTVDWNLLEAGIPLVKFDLEFSLEPKDMKGTADLQMIWGLTCQGFI